jgi:hypothetical protein
MFWVARLLYGHAANTTGVSRAVPTNLINGMLLLGWDILHFLQGTYPLLLALAPQASPY